MARNIITAILNPRSTATAYGELWDLLTKHRQLTWEMAKAEMRDRYAGQWFGSLWTIGHPMIIVLVYVYIFAFVFKLKITGVNDDFSMYLLSGLIPWLSFVEVMSKSGMVIHWHANLVKQVVFPIQILPVKGVLTAVFTQIIMTVLFVGYVLIHTGSLPWTILLLPVVIFLQMLAMIGVAYAISAIGAYFKDIKDIIQVFCTVGLFMIPLFYQVSQVPDKMKWVLYMNPFSHMVWVYRDVAFTGTFDHPYSWLIFVVGSFVIFGLGYRLFRKLRLMFGDVL